jgi:alkylated DNA repair dioxygenase AlkB
MFFLCRRGKRFLFRLSKVLIEEDECLVVLIEDFVTSDMARSLLKYFLESPEVSRTGNRETLYFSNISYSYGRTTHRPNNHWIPQLKLLKDKLNNNFGTNVNSVLINVYRTGANKLGWHSDDEDELGDRPTIYSISLGETRSFGLKNKKTQKTCIVELQSNSLLIMAKETQAKWLHSILPNPERLSSRVNITFRTILG